MRPAVFALFERSLRLESRALSTYLKRLVLALLILFALVAAHLTSLRISASGLHFFSSVATLTLLFISLASLTYFSSVITEEKEEQTLGLLKMSNLNPVAILLGKSTSRLIGIVLLLLSQFPFTLLAVTLGGVSLTQIFAAYATILAYVIFLSNLALFSSVCFKRTNAAAVFTGVMLLGFLFGGWIASGLAGLLRSEFRLSGPLVGALAGLGGRLSEANPFERISAVLATTGYMEPPIGFQVISNLVLGAVFFGLAWASFGFFTREDKDVSPGRGMAFRRSSILRCLGVGRPWRDPVAWKDFHFIAGGRFMVVGRFAFIAALVGFFAWIEAASNRRGASAEFVGGALMTTSLIVAALELVSYVSKTFRVEINWHTLPDLSLAPMSTGRLIVSKLLGCVPALVPYGVCFLLGVFLSPEAFARGMAEVLGHAIGWYVVVQYFSFVSFVAFLSLVMKRAAVVVAFVSWMVLNQFLLTFLAFMMMPGPGAFEVMSGFMALLFVGFIYGMYAACRARLRRLAGE